MTITRWMFLFTLAPLAAVGCTSGDSESPGAGGSTSSGTTTTGGSTGTHPNWAEDVAPILVKNCAMCHQPGGIAPFGLLTYEDARTVAGSMKLATTARTMPPFNPDNTGACQTYSDARYLDAADIATIAAWSDAGAPEGDPKLAPPPFVAPPGLVDKSITLDMGVTYTPDQTLTDEYRCFVVDPKLAKDQFLTGYDMKPGDKREVHHVILFAMDTDAADQAAADLDTADPKDGYQCFGGAGVPSARFVVGWAPGAGASHYPAGTGIKLTTGHKLVMQIHYNLANGAFPDRTTLDLALADSVAKEATITRVAAKNIMLPPGQALAPATGQLKIPAAAGELTIWGVAPHMHTRGKTMEVSLDSAGAKSCITRVDNWNFHWQGFSTYAKPLTMKGGDMLSIECDYDTTKETTTITSGESTSNEMCINFLYVTK
ncbi:MAG: hypothetical protein ABJE95_06640 [Byssovorax sp.]